MVRRDRAARPRIPVTGIRLVAFLAMQVGVNPGSVAIPRGLRLFMGRVPIARPVLPECLEGRAEPGRWFSRRGEGLLENRKCHLPAHCSVLW